MRVVLCIALLCACGGDNKKIDAAVEPKDAPKQIDAPMADAALPDAPSKVVAVDCTGATIATTIMTTTSVFAYQPATATIAAGAIVQFQMAANHNVAPNATDSDDGLHVGFGQTRCLKFTEPGTFGFHCTPHSFTGTVTVN